MSADKLSPFEVIILGGGGHARVVIDILSHFADQLTVRGILDPDKSKHGETISGVPVLGDDSTLNEIPVQDHGVIVALGDNRLRAHLFKRCVNLGFTLINAIHPNATLAKDVKIGVGNVVMAGAVVNSGTIINDNVIINTGATVDHDCVVGSHVHIAPGVHLGGSVRVGEGSQVSIGATVIPEISIGEWSLVGAGTVVIRDVRPKTTVVGVPARIIARQQGEYAE